MGTLLLLSCVGFSNLEDDAVTRSDGPLDMLVSLRSERSGERAAALQAVDVLVESELRQCHVHRFERAEDVLVARAARDSVQVHDIEVRAARQVAQRHGQAQVELDEAAR